jgi:hypothetical protein
MDLNHISRFLLRRSLEELERRDTPAFAALPPFADGIERPAVVASADFNRDGFADVAVANELNAAFVPSVSIVHGSGDGTFTQIQDLTNPLLALPRAITVADLNGDGLSDLVVASFTQGNISENDSGSVMAFLGQADGSFSAAITVSTTPSIAVGVADFNGDGFLDIVSLNPDTQNTTGGFEILTGDGAGGFTLGGGQQGFPFTVNRVVTADFDNDGFSDFIALETTDRLLFAFYGDGTGNFTVPNPGFATLPSMPADIVVGDINGDGLVDLVISSNEAVTFHENLGGRQFDFTGVEIFPISGSIPYRLASADLDSNGSPDIVAVDQMEARVFTSGTGFTEDPTSPLLLPDFSAFSDVAIGDANGDGNLDFIVVQRVSEGPSSGTVFLNLAPVPTVTMLSAAPNPGVVGSPTTFTADVLFNGNPFPFGEVPRGTVDFEVDNAFFGSAPVVDGVATLPANLAGGTHTIVARYSGNAHFQPSFSTPFVITILPVGGGDVTYEFEVTGLPTLPGLGADRVASGSFNDDGVNDIALATGPGRPAEVSLIDGKSRVEIASVMPFGSDFTGGLMVAAGDIDGDGIDDIAVAADVGGGPRISIYLVRDGQLVLTNTFFALDETFRGGLRIALGDIDGDGYADLVVTGGPGAGPRVATYDGRTLTDFQTPQRLFNDFFAMDPNSRLGLFVAVGDLNSDGKAEIAVSSDVGGGPRIVVFNGTSFFNRELEVAADFFAGDPDSRGGLRIAIRDVSSRDGMELIAGDGPGAGSTVRVYTGYDIYFQPDPEPVLTTELLPGYLGGVFVA